MVEPVTLIRSSQRDQLREERLEILRFSKPAPSPLTKPPRCSMPSIVPPFRQRTADQPHRGAEARLVRIRSPTVRPARRGQPRLPARADQVRSRHRRPVRPEYLPKVDAFGSVTAGFRGPLVDSTTVVSG